MSGGVNLAFVWFVIYFILGILFYLYFARLYYYLLINSKLLSKKINIKKEKFLWGEESRWTNNRVYVAKNISLKRNSLFNRIFHKHTVKTFFIVSGKMNIFVEKGNSSHIITLNSEESYEVYPETIYSISAVTDVKYIEISSNIISDTYSYKREKNDRQRNRAFTRRNN